MSQGDLWQHTYVVVAQSGSSRVNREVCRRLEDLC